MNGVFVRAAKRMPQQRNTVSGMASTGLRAFSQHLSLVRTDPLENDFINLHIIRENIQLRRSCRRVNVLRAAHFAREEHHECDIAEPIQRARHTQVNVTTILHFFDDVTSALQLLCNRARRAVGMRL
jgi:hypothetical protein